MAEIVPDVRTHAAVSIQDETFRIDTISAYAAYGSEGTVPDIDRAAIAEQLSQIDGISAAEGELTLALENGADAWLNNKGELVIQTDEANRYSVDAEEGDLLYTQGATPTQQDNTLTEDGDFLVVMVNALIRGKLTMTSFVDTLSGDGVVEKEFRVNTESLFYSDWKPLTDAELAAQVYESNSVLNIEIRYRKVGAAGSVTFDGLTITGSWEAARFEAPTLMASLFASLVGGAAVKKIDDNLFKKLYFRGVVPKYITRADNVSYEEDEDFVALFSTISYFFSLMIAFFKRFENFRNDEELLREQVRGFGIQFDEGNVTLQDLQYLAANYYSQIQQRGTMMIASRAGDALPGGRAAAVDGELVRLLQSKPYNELLIGAIADYKMGWCVGQSSPLYRGTCAEMTLNKTPENTQDFQSLSHFSIATSGGGSVSRVTAGGKSCLRVSISESGAAGIGRVLGDNSDISSFLITADPEISYEITFGFKIASGTKSAINLIFGIEGFNDNGEKLDDAFVNTNGEVADGLFFNQTFSIWRDGVWYFARGIIHAYNTILSSGLKTNLGVGSDLSFNNPFVRLMLPRILVSASASAVVDIWDYKIRPLVWGKSVLPYRGGAEAESNSLGFVQVRNFLYTYARNNNASNTQEQITDIIEKYLYPYNKVDMFVLTGNK